MGVFMVLKKQGLSRKVSWSTGSMADKAQRLNRHGQSGSPQGGEAIVQGHALFILQCRRAGLRHSLGPPSGRRVQAGRGHMHKDVLQVAFGAFVGAAIAFDELTALREF
jgi:hypothetical protein